VFSYNSGKLTIVLLFNFSVEESEVQRGSMDNLHVIIELVNDKLQPDSRVYLPPPLDTGV
jgi:hypothetical protein